MTTLNAEKRDTKVDVKKLRQEGSVPAVLYGPKQEALSIAVKATDFVRAYREAGESTIITLNDGEEDHDVLVQEVAVDPVKGNVLHIDFYAVERGKKIDVSVPLEFVGESPAEKQGGVLMKQLHELDIEAMPRNLPHSIEVSIDSLVDFDTIIHAKDVVLPEGVELKTNPEEPVVFVQEHKEEDFDAETEAPDLDSIEVAGEKPKEEEGEEGEKSEE